MKSAAWGMACMLAGLMRVHGDGIAILSLDPAGRLAFNEATNALAYQVVWTTNIGSGGWSTASPPGVASVPSAGIGVRTVTVGVQQAHCLYRVLATVVIVPSGMVCIPSGSFAMGNATNVFPPGEGMADELPRHTVAVSAFFLDSREVTRALWEAVKTNVSGYGYSSNSGFGKAPDHPVAMVNWYDAVKWCNARSEREGLRPVYYTDVGLAQVYRTNEIAPYADWAANGYRLPTEAEWEKAARGGAPDHRFPWSDAETIQHARANYYSTTNFPYDTSPTRGLHPSYYTGNSPNTSPAGSFAPNGFGLYDVAGNAEEWCWDWYSGVYYAVSPASDPRGAGPGSTRVARGGKESYTADSARCASRQARNPVSKSYATGFRCARRL